jgi:hypothetical protein
MREQSQIDLGACGRDLRPLVVETVAGIAASIAQQHTERAEIQQLEQMRLGGYSLKRVRKDRGEPGSTQAMDALAHAIHRRTAFPESPGIRRSQQHETPSRCATSLATVGFN